MLQASSQESGGAQEIFEARGKWGTVDLVLVIICAALYAAALIAFGAIKLAPGTYLRPGNALQGVFGILFGLPGCLGIALGNLVADFVVGGAPIHAIIAGFIVNFLAAYIPYLAVSNARLGTRRSIIEWYVYGVLIAGAVVAGSVWVNVALGLTPKQIAAMLSPVMFSNQVVASALISPFLLRLLYPFVDRSGLYRGRPAARDRR